MIQTLPEDCTVVDKLFACGNKAVDRVALAPTTLSNDAARYAIWTKECCIRTICWRALEAFE